MASSLVVHTIILLVVLGSFPSDTESKKLPQRVDLCIVAAFGGSRNGQSVNQAMEVAKALAGRISISSSTTRVAMITSLAKATIQFDFKKCLNKECVLKTLKGISIYQPYEKSSRGSIKKALYLASKLFKRTSRPNATKYILLITDSQSVRSRDFSYISRRLRKQHVSTYVIVSKGKLDFKARKGLQVLTGGKVKTRVEVIKPRANVKGMIAAFPFAKVSYSSCTGHGKVLDECERSCICQNNQLVRCTRIRKEFNEMTIEERVRFINAFKALATKPQYKKNFETFIVIHKDLFFKGIHTGDYFLPWHRWYILAFENMLREVDCRITIPYWDWAFWSNTAWHKNIHIWSNEDYGLGGNGDPKRGYCVQDGPFREGVFKTPSFDNPVEVLKAVYFIKRRRGVLPKRGHRSGCLRRSFNGKPIGVPAIKKLLTHKAASFWKFEQAVRMLLHNSMHNEIGGHMCSEYASIAPEFYLHHAFLDKVWYTWQQHSTACMKARFSKMSQKMTKFKCPHSQKEFLDSSKLPGEVSVAYTDYYYSARRTEVRKHGKFTKTAELNDILEERAFKGYAGDEPFSFQRKSQVAEGNIRSDSQRKDSKVTEERSDEERTTNEKQKIGDKQSDMNGAENTDISEEKEDRDLLQSRAESNGENVDLEIAGTDDEGRSQRNSQADDDDLRGKTQSWFDTLASDRDRVRTPDNDDDAVEISNSAPFKQFSFNVLD